MYSFLLKKALPFTLTFIFGAALGLFGGLCGSSEKRPEAVLGTRTYNLGRDCDMRRRRLVAESKPLAILSTPDAWLSRGAVSGKDAKPTARVRVMFGADGRVQEVTPLTTSFRTTDGNLVELKEVWEAVEEAAQQISFTPETINSVPVTVSREVEIRLRSY